MPRQKQVQQAATPRACEFCPLNTAALLHPKMPPTGTEAPDLYILGEAPGSDEDADGVQFVGRSGQFLRQFIPPEYLHRIRWNNVIRCHPEGNRAPAEQEIHCCTPLQVTDIEQTKPKLILGFGNVPLEWLINDTGITKWHGRFFPVQVGEHVCWYMPMYHPSYLVRMSGGNRDLYNDHIRTFDREMQRALWLLDNLPDVHEFHRPVLDALTGVELLTTESEILKALRGEWLKKTLLAIDIETNGLRPFAMGAEILTCSLSDGLNTIAFPLAHPEARTSSQVYKALETLLLGGVTLIAHNAKFEMEWLAHYFGNRILGLPWQDTMGQGYVLDERQGVLNLGALTQINFGVNIKGLNQLDVTRLANEDLRKVLIYNAMDARFTYFLYEAQQRELANEDLTMTYNHVASMLPAIVHAQITGLDIDWDELRRQHDHWTGKIEAVKAKIYKMPEVQKFSFAREDKLLNLNSHIQLKKLFAEQYNLVLESTDEEHLSALHNPLAKLILEYREYNKVVSTYLDPILSRKNVWPDGFLHPNYNPYFTVTGRLSSDGPNIQNFPKREHKEVRNVICAPAGYKMVSFDYGQIEARIIALMSRDPYFLHALENGLDIHMEWAEKLAAKYPTLLKRFGTLKDLRTEIKNTWVFPAFYGARVDDIAGYLGVPVGGLEPLFNEFWMRFKGVKQWQSRLIADYRTKGYVETLTKRRRHGPMKVNELINSPVQGTASDITTRSMAKLCRMALELDLPWLAPVMNIHDDLTFCIPDALVQDAIPLIAEVMCFPDFEWLTVPIVVEVSVGQRWGELKEVATFNSRTLQRSGV